MEAIHTKGGFGQVGARNLRPGCGGGSVLTDVDDFRLGLAGFDNLFDLLAKQRTG